MQVVQKAKQRLLDSIADGPDDDDDDQEDEDDDDDGVELYPEDDIYKMIIEFSRE